MSRLRIVAGELRGRRLTVPRGATYRPTGDRVRESLFNILGGELEARTVVDAYAGSGALGFEALSRGAAQVIFLERDRAHADAIRRHAREFGVDERCQVRCGPTREALRRWVGSPIDLLLADPPYADGEGPALLAQLAENPGILAAGAQLVIERSARLPVPVAAEPLEFIRTARYGSTCLDLYRLVGS